MSGNGVVQISSMDGVEIRPGIILIGEPSPILGTDKLRALANVYGALGIVELSIKFQLEKPIGGKP